MKILLAHNQYQQPGGEDQSVAAEIGMLEAFGHEVIQYRLHNDAIKEMNGLAVAARTLWNRSSYREVRDLIKEHRPDIAHFNNTFPLISPAAYYAAQAEGVPVVQTLRNFRLICPDAYFLRNNQVCESCMGRLIAWPGILHACYRDSRAATATVAAMQTTHRLLGTWKNAVDMYITLTEFGKQTFIRGGLPEKKIVVKPNFVYPDPGRGTEDREYAIFVGRLSEEKGIESLLKAWQQVEMDIPLKIVGGGPLEPLVQAAAAADPRIAWVGQQPPSEVARLVGNAAFLVFPSLWYEGMPRTIIEAFAKGTPVLASNLGAMTDLIVDGQTGVLFTPGGPEAIAASVQRLWASPDDVARMGNVARKEYENRYSFETNYEQLMTIYQRLLRPESGT